MPIVRILEEIRKKIMIFVYKRHERVKTWQDQLPPLVKRRVLEAMAESRALSIIFGYNKSFEVICPSSVEENCIQECLSSLLISCARRK